MDVNRAHREAIEAASGHRTAGHAVLGPSRTVETSSAVRPGTPSLLPHLLLPRGANRNYPPLSRRRTLLDPAAALTEPATVVTSPHALSVDRDPERRRRRVPKDQVS
jgi:hypothetical protein